jgi:hypothetical protein
MTGQTPIIPNDLFQEAVQGFWDTRIAQAQAQVLAGKVDQGNRSAAGGGKQMDGFILTLTNFLLAAGIPQNHIHVKKSLTVISGSFARRRCTTF